MSAQEQKDIRISRLLKDKFICLELKAKDKKEAVAELVDILGQSKKLKNKKIFLKDMAEREKLGSTGIGNGAAIPHGKSAAVKDFILGFARKNAGIDFGALDGEKTYLFFALAASKEEVGRHLKILAQISHLVKDKFTVQLLKRARDKKEVLKIISKAEEHLRV